MTRVLTWVRALTHGRRRITPWGPRPAMVLARRLITAATAPLHIHVDYHHALWRRAPAPAAGSAATTVERQIVRWGETAPRGARGASGPPGRAGEPASRGHAGTLRVVAPLVQSAPAPIARAASPPLPAVAASARAAAKELAEVHRRIEAHAPPRLRALPVEPRMAQNATHGAPQPRRPAPVLASQEPAPARVLRRSESAIAQSAAQAAVAAAAATPGRELASPRHPAAPSALDLETLTERVVAQIDRRIVAHRERFGQL